MAVVERAHTSLASTNQGTNFSLVALGNSMKRSQKVLPAWVSPVERDSAFWRSGTEGISLLFNVMGSTSFLVVIVATKFCSGLFLRLLLTRWHRGSHPHRDLALASCWLLLRIAHQVRSGKTKTNFRGHYRREFKGQINRGNRTKSL